MKLTQMQAIEAYTIVRKLESQEMDARYAKVLFDIKKALEPQFVFQNEQERKTVQLVNASIDEMGIITFPDAEAKQKYIDKMNEVAAVETDVAIEKKPFDISGLRMSAKDIEALDLVADIVC